MVRSDENLGPRFITVWRIMIFQSKNMIVKHLLKRFVGFGQTLEYFFKSMHKWVDTHITQDLTMGSI